MISSVTNPELFVGSTTSTPRTPKKTLDKDAFLQLLVTQLKNQDPSNTMDVTQMSSQLAQFASVEQLTLLNDSMTAQSQATQLSMLVGQTSFSASLLGKEIVASGNQVHIADAGSTRVHVDVGGAGGVGTLKLYDSTGSVVATRSLGRVAPGTQNLTLPSDLPAGDWHYGIDVTDGNGKAVNVTTYVTGTVTGVQFLNGSIRLQIGGIDLSLDDLVSIGHGANTTTTTTPPVVTPVVLPPAQPGDADPGTILDRQR